MASITALQQSEAALVGTIRAAAAALSEVGTSDLDAALARLQEAADAAKKRLEAGAERAKAAYAALAADTTKLASDLLADLTPEPRSMAREALAARQRLNDEADRKARESEEAHRARMAAAAQPAGQAVAVAANGPVEPARQWPEAPLADDETPVASDSFAARVDNRIANECDHTPSIPHDDDTDDAAEMPADPAPAAPAPKQARKRGKH